MSRLFNKISPSGLTPTGPAMKEAIKSFDHSKREGDWQKNDSLPYHDETGMAEWNENIR